MAIPGTVFEESWRHLLKVGFQQSFLRSCRPDPKLIDGIKTPPDARAAYFQPSPTRPKLPAGTERTGMALKRMVLEIGMGADPTKAAVRASREAL